MFCSGVEKRNGPKRARSLSSPTSTHEFEAVIPNTRAGALYVDANENSKRWTVLIAKGS